MENTDNLSLCYKPRTLDIDPNSTNASREWRHWKTILNNYIEDYGTRIPNKLRALISFLSPLAFEMVENCTDFKSAMDRLESVYVKKPNEVFARHLLATRKQRSDETLNDFFESLERLRRDCNFRDRTAKEIGDEAVRDAFICGLLSPAIRQRLLENKNLDLQTAYDQALTIDLAEKNNASVLPSNSNSYMAVIDNGVAHGSTDIVNKRRGEEHDTRQTMAAATFTPSRQGKASITTTTDLRGKAGKRNACFFCGTVPFHKRSICPAREAICHRCSKYGHFQKMCRSLPTTNNATIHSASCISIDSTNIPVGLQHAATSVTVQSKTLNTLIDSGASENFICEKVAKSLSMKIFPLLKQISMAKKSCNSQSKGFVVINFTLNLNGESYSSIRLTVVKDLCCDIVLGRDFQSRHLRVTFEYGGQLPELVVKGTGTCLALKAANLPEPTLFPGISAGCKPIATKSRRFSEEDLKFIAMEVDKLLDDGIIEPSVSPWRAQVVVVKDETKPKKKRLCVDYSQTVNIYTEQEAFPLPRISDLITKLAKFKYFSTFDLKSAYHQVKINE
ncbi:uncharacterized protein LOC115215493, partial [Argonauta hians]